MSEDEIATEAVDLAAVLLTSAQALQTRRERAHAAKLWRLMEDPAGKTVTATLTDQVFRSSHFDRIANQLRHVVSTRGIPRYLDTIDQIALRLACLVGEYVPGLVIPRVIAKLRKETRSVLMPSEEPAFSAYVRSRRTDGIRLNLNQLGEAILGEDEAQRRLEAYVRLLERPDVEYVSIKISSVLSQISLLAFEETVNEVKTRLRTIYRAAAGHRFTDAFGRSVVKFVNLDMEEYRDLHLTVEAFRQVLDEPEFAEFHAGIVLQAYLPDSHQVQQDLTAWACRRVHSGAAPIKLRVVKGANLAMEKIDAAVHGWPQAPYETKAEVDANYKRMVVYALQPEHAVAVRVGIASHNLFDVAFGLLLRSKHGTEQFVEFEMLEGMANHQARAVKTAAGGLLIYAPVVKHEDFHSAISYLMRRLDENTAPGNFLRDLFGLTVGSDKWGRQQQMFLSAVARRNEIFLGPRRSQNRNEERRSFAATSTFCNEPDTDWSLRCNQDWIKRYVSRWRLADVEPVPLHVNGQLRHSNQDGVARDPSAPENQSYRYALGTMADVDEALRTAVTARSEWTLATADNRRRILMLAAATLADRRGDLIGVMMRDTGKSVAEGDVEVSEAVDLANYYARAFDALAESSGDVDTVASSPLGTILVTPPWNFPLAIPVGGVLAALMAGNTVIFKPAPEAVLTGWHLCNALWDAGVPTRTLQFLPTADDVVGQALVMDERVDAIILTGSYATASLFRAWRPQLRLYAETSGKNCLIISALADLDQAIKDLIRSAFGHSGQKCSAVSVAVIEAEVYDNPRFLKQLRDATKSLVCGPAWNLSSNVTPLVRAPREELLRALTQLDEGETWLLEPRPDDDNLNLWSPGIKLNVKRGSWFHRTECFGPVLGLIRADSIDDAISIVNDSDFGLTTGLHSLDDREISKWREVIEAGNVYINRGTTGAIVQRQPFGGWKRSAFGAAKAGGPNYVLSFCQWDQINISHRKLGTNDLPLGPRARASSVWVADHLEASESNRVMAALQSYHAAWASHFSKEHDPSNILGESNCFRYRPIRATLIRVSSRAELADGILSLLAAEICGVPATLSVAIDIETPILGADLVFDDEPAFVERISSFERVRSSRPLSRQACESANAAHTLLIDVPVVTVGRLELRHYLREQCVSQTLHRYGAMIGSPR